MDDRRGDGHTCRYWLLDLSGESMTENSILFGAACIMSAFISILVTGLDFHEANQYEKRKAGIIFLTSFLWGWFSWVGVIVLLVFFLAVLPFAFLGHGIHTIYQTIQAIRTPRE